jgi:hypothetical protein
MFSQTVCVKNAMSKRTFFCFIAASGNLHEDARTFYCCRPHTFATKALLCNSQYLYTVDSDVALSDTNRMQGCVPTATTVRLTRLDVTFQVPCLVTNDRHCDKLPVAQPADGCSTQHSIFVSSRVWVVSMSAWRQRNLLFVVFLNPAR